MPGSITNMLSEVVSCLVKIGLLAVFSKYLRAAIPVLAIAVYFLQRFYLLTSRQVRLLGIEARAPLVTHFTESIAGAITIRAFGWQEKHQELDYRHIDVAQKPDYLQSCIQHWLGFVLDVMVTVLAVALIGTVVTWHGKFSPGDVGVSLLMVMDFASVVAALIREWTMLESSIGAVARIKRFSEESEEEDSTGRSDIVPPEWPQAGAMRFTNVMASYQ